MTALERTGSSSAIFEHTCQENNELEIESH